MGVLDGKVAIVTGAGQGVGQGIALAFAAEGARLALAGRREETLGETAHLATERGAGDDDVVVVRCDVNEQDDLEALVARTVDAFGTVDILVNNAQEVPLGYLLEVKDKAFLRGFTSGPLAVLRLMRACHPYLKDGGGAIVNLGSGSALRADPIGLGCYAAVKEAMRAITRAAAVEWGPDGIRANMLLPLAMSPGMQWWSEHFTDDYLGMLREVPLGRIGDCEADIGRAAVFLCGPDGAYVNGTTLVVDGGQTYLR
jgi:meso-butanediol dehydrogenase / (S,S)-butanediol dehydrogenase / diacetyl reductase